MNKYDKFEGHTPGPWESNGFGTDVYSEEHGTVANTKTNYHFTDEERNTNTALIAAAPDLLAACKPKDEIIRGLLDMILCEAGGNLMCSNCSLRNQEEKRRKLTSAKRKFKGGLRTNSTGRGYENL